MEPQIKLPAASSSSSGKQRSVIDDLPDHIVHNILRFFTIKDIAIFSTLSKRCRNLCLTVPSLNIVLTGNQIWHLRSVEIMNFIDRYMIHRNDFKLESFKLSWLFTTNSGAHLHNEKYRLDSWLHQVARCDIEKLDLWIYLEETIVKSTFALPLCFTRCTSLKYLQLALFNGVMKLPSVGFKFLRCVLLSEAYLQQELFEVWLSNCKSLEKLRICNVKGIESLNIKNGCLQSLEIVSNWQNFTSTLSTINVSACRLGFLSLYWLSSYQGKRKLVISAPNLDTLLLEGDIANCDYHIKSLNSLQKVSVYSLTNPTRLLSKTTEDSTTTQCLQILPSVCQAKMLHLNSAFVTPLLLRPSTFKEVQSLDVQFTPDIELRDVLRIASLLILFPNLQSLTLRFYFDTATPIAYLLNNSIKAIIERMEFLLSQSRYKVFDKLKLIEIDLDRRHYVLVLIEYLLKHAKELNKMTIYYSPEEDPRLSNTITSVQGFSKASATAAVYVLPRVVPLAPEHGIFYSTNSFSD